MIQFDYFIRELLDYNARLCKVLHHKNPALKALKVISETDKRIEVRVDQPSVEEKVLLKKDKGD